MGVIPRASGQWTVGSPFESAAAHGSESATAQGTDRAWPRGQGGPVTPGCRLWLEGWDGQEGACDIVELSAHGVTIALSHVSRSPRGVRGDLLIGPPGEDHYAVPVAVRHERRSPEASILELEFQDNERWSYHRGRDAITASTSR